jgi:hypothetical protein
MVGPQATPLIFHVVAFILFLAIGLLGTFWARAVQAYELKFYSGFNPVLLVSFIQDYVKSEIYLWQIRILGVLCLIGAAVLFYTVPQWPH